MPSGRHLSRGPKMVMVVGAVIAIVVGALVSQGYFALKSEPAGTGNEPVTSNTPSEPFVAPVPTDTVEVGALDFYRSPQGQDQGDLVQHGEVRTSLIFDEHSYCNLGSGGLPCMAMNVSFSTAFSGRRALVDGNKEGNAIRVRRLRVVEGDEVPRVVPAGTVYIPWIQARSLILSCATKSLLQTHEGLVFITQKDGTKVTAVEPVIDEVFTVANEAGAKCGAIQLGTE